ncbi:MAG: hypothetical protein JSU68_01075 [Phycisphaerales bacterium]|nr:MAG: hypothetical protein JSU68_01075 [Phycisphaerales bacterium]
MSRVLIKAARVVVLGGAWFFAVASGLYAAGAGASQLIGPNTSSTLYGTYVEGERYEAVKLTYDTAAEHLFAGVQALFVFGCLVLSTGRRLALRRIGHLGLIVWAGLWLGNMIRFLFIEEVWITVVTTAVIAFLFACTVLRAVIGWTPRSA